MATRVSVNGGASGVGLPGTTTSDPSASNDLSQNLESNSSFDSDILPSFLPESHTKKRRKQSRPSRIPATDSDSNPLNLSKGGAPLTPPQTFFLNQPPFAALFANNQSKDSRDQPTTPPLDISGGGGSGDSGGSHGSSINSNSTKEQGTLVPQPHRIFNPEAYCGLCNKEFCNKYFLKTHKANKHGVYTDPPPPTNGSYLPPLGGGDISAGEMVGRRSTGNVPLEGGDEDRDDDEGRLLAAITCHFCGSEFQTEAEFRTHLGDKHGLVVPPFLLPFPPPSSPTAPTSLFDLPKNSPSEAFDCSRCSRSFSTLYLLRMHTSYFHPPTPTGCNNNNKDEADDSLKDDCLSPEEPGETTSDSDELRRLQSMILELNPLAGSLTAAAVADGSSTSNWNTTGSPPPNSNSAHAQNMPSVCPLCAKEFYSPTFLAQHMEQSHSGLGQNQDGADSSKTASDPFLLPSTTTAPGSSSSSLKGERRPSPSLSRSYCTICHKELCNKYFMRTHMLKMHGISIESSTGLGGVTCDICNKELCSKYFLKVHKQNTHGILEEGPSPPAEVPDPTTTSAQVTTVAQAAQQGNSSSNDGLPLDLHAASEGCPICSKRFRSVKWLKNHLLTDHGPEGRDAWKLTKKSVPLSPKNTSGKSRSRGSRARNGTSEDESSSQQQQQQQQQRLMLDPLSIFFGKMENSEGGNGAGSRIYRCTFCPFTTTLLVYHYAHERTHTGLGTATHLLPDPASMNNFQCPMCFQGVGSLEAFQQHLFNHGLLPSFLPQATQAQTLHHPLPPATPPPPAPKPRKVAKGKVGVRAPKRKRLVFRCSACKLTFGERAACLGHVKRDHRTPQLQRHRSGKDSKFFRCRKCSFTSGTYAKWRVHFKVHHNHPPKMFEVLGGGSGVVLQRFLLGVGEGEPFVPSLVYLPVRSKVSESREVSFSLTPRS